MIIIRTIGGLCNRMRALNSAIHLGKINKQNRIKLVWERNKDLNASFNDLFEPIEGVKVAEYNPIFNHFDLFAKRKKTIVQKIKYKALKHYFKVLEYKYLDNQTIRNYRYNSDYWENLKPNVVLDTCYDFFEIKPETNHYQLFVPRYHLKKRIKHEVSRFGDYTVGLHIRRTDNKNAIEYSSTDLFIDKMEALLKNNPETRFFLATDDPQLEDDLCKRFGSTILTQKSKDLDRNSKKAIEDAVVDLYSLSQTQLILGSYWSSFSNVAAEINKKELIIISK